MLQAAAVASRFALEHKLEYITLEDAHRDSGLLQIAAPVLRQHGAVPLVDRS